jgi:VWFA-related protein
LVRKASLLEYQTAGSWDLFVLTGIDMVILYLGSVPKKRHFVSDASKGSSCMNHLRRTLALRSSTLFRVSFFHVGFLVLACAFITAAQALAQTPITETPPTDATVLTMNARTVIVDVVVTGKDGRPVQGLHQQDFAVSEDGHPQQITTFEEHPGPHPPPPLPPLPRNIFTNIPRASPAGSPIVLLLDSLNTPLADQTLVRQQMLSYLKHLQPGVPMAIFTLGSQLRYIQGFTDDPAVLRSVANNLHSGAAQEGSPLLKTKPETTTEQTAIAQVADTPGMGQMAAALQQFLAEQKSSQDSVRALTTLDALQKLAHYLGGIPGRKSVIWFSGSFPSYIFLEQTLTGPSTIERTFFEESRKTVAALATAEVAIYPIAAEGLANNSLYDADNQITGHTSSEVRQRSIDSLSAEDKQRNADHTTMDQIAKDTGGRAFYNNNGIDKAIARVAENAAHYYTLSYTPSDAKENDHFRKIKVQLTSEHASLAYRDGYFAINPAPPKALDPKVDPLVPYMQPDVPDSTEIPLALLLQPAPTTATCPSDNHDLTAPLPCESAVFVIAAKGLQFATAHDGSKHDTVEVTLIAYNDHGEILNWIVRRVNLDMDATRYAQVQSNGVHFNLALGIPEGATTLRGGVYDPASGLAGTLAVPLANDLTVNASPSPSKPR